VYPIRGEKDFRNKYYTPEQQREWQRIYYAKKQKAGGYNNERYRQIQRKYLASCPKSKARDWETWEQKFLDETRHLPARLVAFALQRGIRAVQCRRLGVGANKERCRLWRLKQKKAALPKETKRRTSLPVSTKKSKPSSVKETGISKHGSKQSAT
jgi:hypothetical protein